MQKILVVQLYELKGVRLFNNTPLPDENNTESVSVNDNNQQITGSVFKNSAISCNSAPGHETSTSIPELRNLNLRKDKQKEFRRQKDRERKKKI